MPENTPTGTYTYLDLLIKADRADEEHVIFQGSLKLQVYLKPSEPEPEPEPEPMTETKPAFKDKVD